MKTYALLGLLGGLAIGCGAADETPAQAPATDNQPTETPTNTPPVATPPLDHGAPSTTYPAFTPDIAQLVFNGGVVLANPVVVTITWTGDTHADDFEHFGDVVGQGDYWKQVTSEYGVGPATSGPANHVRITTPAPTSMSDSDIQTFVANSVTAATSPWPTPAAGEPIYIIYLPKTTDLKLGNSSACKQGVGGYHDSIVAGDKHVAYAVIPQCSQMDEITLAASHELGEAATDPHPTSAPAWTGFDLDHLSWEFFNQFQSENGDACEFYKDAMLSATESDVPFAVQRQWSNASARAGHDPCVPARPGTYFSVSPLNQEAISVDLSQLGGGTETTMGYKIKVGESRQIPLGFYSDGAMPAWKITATEGGMYSRAKGNVDLELDVDQGQNGEKAYLKVTVNTAGRTGTELVTVVSTARGVSHYMPILIGQE